MSPRRHLLRRPAPGQLAFWFVLSPVPICLNPAEAPQRARPVARRNYPRGARNVPEAGPDSHRTVSSGRSIEWFAAMLRVCCVAVGRRRVTIACVAG
jgi:hypothetical protein